MLHVSGTPFQQSEQWPAGSIERLIIQRMKEDSINYTYQSMKELEFELTLRKNIILSGKAMSQGEAQFETFAGSRRNPRYWNLTAAGGFQLKRGISPSAAIRDIFTNSSLYAFECATAIIIVYYYAVLNSIGEQLFNRFFQNLYLYSWHVDPDLGLQSLYSKHFLPGDVVYFINPDVDPQYYWWIGENAVVNGDGTYFGHGIGITTAEQIIQHLNEARKPGSTRSAYLTDQIVRPSFQHLARLSQLPRAVNKIQHAVIHHNETSIPCSKYLFYLYTYYMNTNNTY